ncbi:hypothetical protein ACKKBG_A18220 [Auxenochlorella protothecoides x Auxenochlorella symbiontica]
MSKLTPALVGQLHPGESLGTVQRLDVAGRGITTVVGMESCTGLTRLDASDNGLTSADGIAALPALRWLSLAGNQVESIEPLRSCDSLEVLNIANNRLSGKVALGRLSRLKALVANNNAITLVGALDRCKELNTLILSHNAVASVSGWLAGAGPLQKLQLSHNMITDLGNALSHLTKLKELRLNHNKLTSFPADLSALASLRTLEAGSNPIASLDALQPLAGLPDLRQLSLKGCPVAALEKYRSHVQGLLPRLQVLDGQRLSAKSSVERRAVEAATEARKGTESRARSSATAKVEKEKAKKRKGEAVQEAAGAELDQQEVDASVKAKRKKVKEPSGNAAPSPGDKGAAVASLSKPLKKAAHARPPPKMPAQTEGNESEGDDAVAFVEPKKKGGAVAPDKEERLQAVARTGVVKVVDVARLETSKAGKKASKVSAGKPAKPVVTGSAVFKALLKPDDFTSPGWGS